MILEKAYAKVNLALGVKEKREDNFHEIDTIMAPIDLYDELYFSKQDEGINIIGDFDGLNIEDNFIYKAAVLFLNTYNINSGVSIKVVKRIPIMAGLAGGSSNASATLRGLNKLFNCGIELSELCDLSSKLGSDMPYCVYQRLSRCSGRGEIVSLIDIKYEKIPITIIKPFYGISTKEVYEKYQYQMYDRDDNYNNIIEGLINNDIKLLNDNIFNDLTKSSLSINDNYLSIYKKISENYNVFVSGSGPTLFVLTHEDIIKTKNLLVIKTFII